MTPKSYTRAGWLTPYALAAGYVHLTENTMLGTRVCLSCINSELRLYDVTVVVGGVRTQRLGFVGLSSARKFYRKNVIRLFGAIRWRHEPGYGSVIA